jgi:hypothetical protein
LRLKVLSKGFRGNPSKAKETAWLKELRIKLLRSKESVNLT